jgi:hypothetical protein
MVNDRTIGWEIQVLEHPLNYFRLASSEGRPEDS